MELSLFGFFLLFFEKKRAREKGEQSIVVSKYMCFI